MADNTISVRTKQKNDTADRWTLANPVLFSGEIGFSTENGRTKIKVGDGTTRWGSLPYISVNVADIPDFPDLSIYMTTQNPTGTGSFSLNRKAGTNIGTNSVAVGQNCEASGNYSSAEGYGNTASGSYAHAEGRDDIASGDWGSHAEGHGTAAKGTSSHAEGIGTIADFGEGQHVEGRDTKAYGNYTHAEGRYSTAGIVSLLATDEGAIADTSDYDHAEGNSTKASGGAAHAEGKSTTASGAQSHAEGSGTVASGAGSHAEGADTKAETNNAHAEGWKSVSKGDASHAEGTSTEASGNYSHAEGRNTTASGACSHSGGYYTEALGYQYAIGHYNDTTLSTAGSTTGTTGTAFVVGNGTASTKSNAVRITYDGQVVCKKAYSATGADYAEMREWLDGNPNDEDRRGYFVTLIDDKIKIAEPGDYIEGIVSGNPAVIGNHDECWMGQNLRDEFGNFIYEDIAVEDEKTGKTSIVKAYKINPDYDPDQPYISRSERREWSPVGMLGHLSVRDDGTCVPNGYCQVTHGGIATAADKGYRVVKRISENIVEIVFSIYAQL